MIRQSTRSLTGQGGVKPVQDFVFQAPNDGRIMSDARDLDQSGFFFVRPLFPV